MKAPLSLDICFTCQLGPNLEPDQEDGGHYHLEVGNSDVWLLSEYLAADMHELRTLLRETGQPDVQSAALYLALQAGVEDLFDSFSEADVVRIMGKQVSREEINELLTLFKEVIDA